MIKDSPEKRSVEQADQLVGAIHRLAAAIEQQNARPPVAGFTRTMGTPMGSTVDVGVLPLRHYNEKPSEAQHEQQSRSKRRPRQASRGKG